MTVHENNRTLLRILHAIEDQPIQTVHYVRNTATDASVGHVCFPHLNCWTEPGAAS